MINANEAREETLRAVSERKKMNEYQARWCFERSIEPIIREAAAECESKAEIYLDVIYSYGESAYPYILGYLRNGGFTVEVTDEVIIIGW